MMMLIKSIQKDLFMHFYLEIIIVVKNINSLFKSLRICKDLLVTEHLQLFCTKYEIK